MRGFLFFVGWASVVGSVIDGIILLHAVWIVFAGPDGWGMDVETHIRAHLSFFSFFIDLAYFLFPDPIVSFFLSWPTVIYYTVRMFVSILIGNWALATAERMGERQL